MIQDSEMNDHSEDDEVRLQRQKTDLQAIAEISLLVATAMDRPNLMQQIVTRIQERFNLYHTQIFLVDPKTNLIVLTVETDTKGKIHSTPVQIPIYQERSIVAKAARTRQGLIVNDTINDPIFLPHALLPQTRAEMAAPIIFGDELLGVIDVQDDQVNRFTDRDLDILLILGSETAVAIQNSRYLNQLLERQAQVQEAMSIARMGDYQIDFLKGTVKISPQARDLLGEDLPDHVNGEYPLYPIMTGLLFPQSNLNLEPGRKVDTQDLSLFPEQRRLVIQRGDKERHLINRTRLLKDENGCIIGLAGSIQDVTEQIEIEQTLRERERYLGILNEIGRQAAVSIDLQSLLDILSSQFGDLIYADGCYITLWDEENECAVPGSASGNLQDIYQENRLFLNELSLTDPVLRLKRPLAIPDVLNSPFINQQVANQYSIISILGLPLISGQRKLGAILVAFSQAHFFTQHEIAICEQAADQVALAITKIYAIQEAQSQAREAEILRQVGTAVAATLDLNEAISRILEQLSRIIPYDSATVLMLRNEALEIVGGLGFDDLQSIIGLRFILDETSPSTVVIHEARPHIVTDVQQKYSSFEKYHQNQIHGWLGVPLVVKERIIGMIAIDSTKPGAFNEKHAKLAAAIADQVAIALENARLFEDTQRLAITDTLTELFNRRHFFTLAHKELERALRYKHPLSAIMIDLDHFKVINDTYGHSIGDRVLQAVASLCISSVRATDITARYGGEEFIILLPETDLDQAYQTAERLRLVIASASFSYNEITLQVTISLGIDTFQATGDSTESIDTALEKLIDNADQALLYSKHTGRNRTSAWKTIDHNHPSSIT